MDSYLLAAGLGALFLSLLGVSLALFTSGAGRGAVSRTVRTADRAYRLAPAAPGGGTRGSLPQQATAVGRTLTPAGAVDRLGRRLDQAGNPSRLGTDAVLTYKGLGLFVGAAAAVLPAVLFAGPLGAVGWIVAGGLVGFFVPNLIVLHLAQERQQQIQRTLPDILDILVVTVEAGMGFEAALAQVVRNGRGPMVGEFARVLHEMQIGQPRVDALREMGARTSVVELKAFASAVVQATTLGIPMANVLRQQSSEMRTRRRQRAEELAQKVPVKIIFPMVLCLLPALFVVVVGPGIIRLVNAFGH